MTLQIWTAPAPMDSGAPEPTLLVEGTIVWVAYRANDPGFPGWGHPDTEAYLERHPGEPFGVLRFDGVGEQQLGPPCDERLREHPLWGEGLRQYAFHHVDGTRWIVTFHDDTLDVTAIGATASPMVFAANPLEAIEKVRDAR